MEIKMSDDWDTVRNYLDLLQQTLWNLAPGIQDDPPEDVRRRLLTLACSVNDYVFWVYKKPQADDMGPDPSHQMYYAEEIETGIGALGVTAREALDNYFKDDLL